MSEENGTETPPPAGDPSAAGANDGQGTPPPEADGNKDGKEPPKSSGLELATAVAQRLDAKKAELEDIEKKIDQKIIDFKALVASTETEGRALAGQPAMTEEQKSIAAAQSLVEGTGLNPFAPVEKKK